MNKQRTARFANVNLTRRETVKCDHCGAVCTFRDSTQDMVTGALIGRYIHPDPMHLPCVTADNYRRGVVLL